MVYRRVLGLHVVVCSLCQAAFPKDGDLPSEYDFMFEGVPPSKNGFPKDGLPPGVFDRQYRGLKEIIQNAWAQATDTSWTEAELRSKCDVGGEFKVDEQGCGLYAKCLEPSKFGTGFTTKIKLKDTPQGPPRHVTHGTKYGEPLQSCSECKGVHITCFPFGDDSEQNITGDITTVAKVTGDIIQSFQAGHPLFDPRISLTAFHAAVWDSPRFKRNQERPLEVFPWPSKYERMTSKIVNEWLENFVRKSGIGKASDLRKNQWFLKMGTKYLWDIVKTPGTDRDDGFKYVPEEVISLSESERAAALEHRDRSKAEEEKHSKERVLDREEEKTIKSWEDQVNPSGWWEKYGYVRRAKKKRERYDWAQPVRAINDEIVDEKMQIQIFAAKEIDTWIVGCWLLGLQLMFARRQDDDRREHGLDRHAFAYAFVLAQGVQQVFCNAAKKNKSPDCYFGPPLTAREKPSHNYNYFGVWPDMESEKALDVSGYLALARSRLLNHKLVAKMDWEQLRKGEISEQWDGNQGNVDQLGFVRHWLSVRARTLDVLETSPDSLSQFHYFLIALFKLVSTVGVYDRNFRVRDMLLGPAFHYASVMVEEWPQINDEEVARPDRLGLWQALECFDRKKVVDSYTEIFGENLSEGLPHGEKYPACKNTCEDLEYMDYPDRWISPREVEYWKEREEELNGDKNIEDLKMRCDANWKGWCKVEDDGYIELLNRYKIPDEIPPKYKLFLPEQFHQEPYFRSDATEGFTTWGW